MDQVFEFFKKLFDTSDFPPRWHCGRWSDFLGWLYISSDLLIWSAYFAIPILILWYVSKRKLPKSFFRIFFLFALFILACGSTHALDALIFWYPFYRVSALADLFTGIISWITVIALVKLLPHAFALKSPLELQNEIDHRVRAEKDLIKKTSELEKEVELRKKAENELQQKNKLYATAQQIARIGHWQWDAVSNYVEWSDEIYRIMDLPLGMPLNLDKVMAMVHHADLEQEQKIIDGVLAGSSYADHSYRMLTPQNEVKYLLAKGEVERDENGDIVKILGTMQDVSQQREFERQIMEKNKKLEIINTELENFVHVASHDLQEPLRKIATFSSMLEVKTKFTEGREEKMYIDRIVDSSTRIKWLITDLIDFTRLSKDEDNFELSDLNDIIQTVLLKLEDVILAKKAIVTIGKLPEACVIPDLIHRVLYNLLNNSLKFSRNDVVPQISVKAVLMGGDELPGYIVASIASENPLAEQEVRRMKFYQLSVQDNGIGFEQRYAEKIFTIFQKLHSKVEFDGSGIGLAICKKVAEKHHGYIYAISQPGQGSLFVLTLPVNPQEFSSMKE